MCEKQTWNATVYVMEIVESDHSIFWQIIYLLIEPRDHYS